MAPKQDKIVVSIPQELNGEHIRQALRLLALELDCDWGKGPSVSALVVQLGLIAGDPEKSGRLFQALAPLFDIDDGPMIV